MRPGTGREAGLGHREPVGARPLQGSQGAAGGSVKAALSGSQTKAPGFAGGYLLYAKTTKFFYTLDEPDWHITLVTEVLSVCGIRQLVV